MRYVIEALRIQDAKAQLPVIRMEIDYELVTLHDAMLANDKVKMIKAKERLEHFRQQLLKIEDE